LVVGHQPVDPAPQLRRFGERDTGVDDTYFALRFIRILLFHDRAHSPKAVAQHAPVARRIIEFGGQHREFRVRAHQFGECFRAQQRHVAVQHQDATGIGNVLQRQLHRMPGTALFGLVRATDPVPAYRLSAGSVLADRPTLALLSHLARNRDPARLMVLGTFRADEVAGDHPLRALITELQRDHAVEELELTGLDEDDVGRLCLVACAFTPDAEFVSSMRRETEGNPFFVREICSHVHEIGAANKGGGFTLETLGPWTGRGDEDADRFAGTARYTLTFDAPMSATPSGVMTCAMTRTTRSSSVRSA